MNEFLFDVSVVIPVYNVEKYLEECIESVLNQKGMKNRIEILLIDDGSSDSSVEICKKYSSKFSNITLISQKNSGVSEARNNGIKNSKGKYIMLLDSDDTLSKYSIKNLFSFFEKNYDFIDILTYPIVFNQNGHLVKNPRYDEYTNGTGIYDVNEFIYLNQSTINIMFKNEGENTLLFDKNMKLSEDQNFCTELIMRKEKIGFVKNAIYYYRRHGAGVSQTINNPYYCFEDIMKYNETILEKYKQSGRIPRYVQSLVINTIKWRLSSDQLLPYHYDEEQFEEALNRIKNLIENISTSVLMNVSGLSYVSKIYLLRFIGRNLNVEYGNSIDIYCDELLIKSTKSFDGYISKLKLKDNNIIINGQVFHPTLEELNDIFVDIHYTDGTVENKKIKLFESTDIYNITSMNEKRVYGFDLSFDIRNVENFEIYLKNKSKKVKIQFKFKRFAPNNFVTDGINVLYSAKSYKFKVRKGFINKIKSYARKDIRCIKRRSKSIFNRIASHFLYNKDNIWIYSDRGDTLDNAYIQFKHDFNKNDGVTRYYVCKMNKIDINANFDKEEKPFIVEQGSLKHKMLFINSKKIITSFIDLQVYCPLKAISYYNDLLKYDLIYLQHGILHANLLKMYSKEFTQIDKFVVSTNFEIKNLTTKYHYNKEDLIISGMPRMGEVNAKTKIENTILFAPSWRKYLIGGLINNKRNLKTDMFIKSDFFKKTYEFLHSDELKKILKENNYTLDFKLHPIFKEYAYLYKLDNNKYVNISFSSTVVEKYKIFITDFSSFQFDFVKLKRPIVYFLPDKKEFDAGLHSYRELDLKYEDAFGPLCLDSDSVLDELTHIIKSGKVDKKYLDRMNKMFVDIKNPCEEIYNSIIK